MGTPIWRVPFSLVKLRFVLRVYCFMLSMPLLAPASFAIFSDITCTLPLLGSTWALSSTWWPS